MACSGLAPFRLARTKEFFEKISGSFEMLLLRAKFCTLSSIYGFDKYNIT
jgi:hypothetical protein